MSAATIPHANTPPSLKFHPSDLPTNPDSKLPLSSDPSSFIIHNSSFSPAPPNSVLSPQHSVLDSWPRSIQSLFEQLTDSIHLDNLLSNLKITEQDLLNFLNSDKCKQHLDLRRQLFQFQVTVHAQDHVRSAIFRLGELARCDNPITARIAATQLLELAGITPPPQQKPLTRIQHEVSHSVTRMSSPASASVSSSNDPCSTQDSRLATQDAPVSAFRIHNLAFFSLLLFAIVPFLTPRYNVPLGFTLSTTESLTMPAIAKRPFVLIVRDGWGQNPHPEQDSYNAIKLAKHPVDDRLMRDYPNVLIKTSGEDVGLPVGVMGNSEVGHQNIGAGRIVDQETMRITRRIREDDGGGFFANKILLDAFAHAKKQNSNVHILGLCSDGRVHSDQEHAYALLEMAKKQNFPGDRVLIHAITDGRDTAPTGAARYLPALEAKCKELGVGRIATIIGRFYAMDRDNRWERVQAAYELFTENKGTKFPTTDAALQSYYKNASDASRSGDEFVVPSVIGAGGKIQDNDTVIFFNYRGDRPREITKAFVYNNEQFAKEPNNGFQRNVQPKNLYFATMAAYETGLPVHVVFDKPEKMNDIFGETLASHGLPQIRSAETEKFPHVTFFFDDYREPRSVNKDTMDGIGPFNGEEIKGAHSRKDIKTYDLAPEMSAEPLTQTILKAIAADKHDVYIINFANGDMVGHTGSLPAAIKAVEKVDDCVGRIVDAILKKGGALIVTADHGNCEQMWDPIHNCPHTAHTTYDVPLIVVDDRFKGAKLKTGGRLADIAPTALKILGLPQPKEMTGQSLLP